MNNINCNCLYQALLTTRDEYSREEARSQYVELINAANSLSNPAKDNVTELLNLAKNTLGNMSSERAYYNQGNISNSHHCDEYSETLETICQLAKAPTYAEYHTSSTSKETSLSELSPKTPDNELEIDNQIEIERITDHRFRGRKLKLSIVINPGNLTIIEDEDRVTAKAREKVAEYFAKLKREHPRRIRHIIRMKPHLLKLLDGAPE